MFALSAVAAHERLEQHLSVECLHLHTISETALRACLVCSRQTLRTLMWALAHAKAGELLTPEVREALAAAVIKSLPFNSQKGLEVLIWASRRNMLDMQDVYLAATAAVRMRALFAAAGFRVRVIAMALHLQVSGWEVRGQTNHGERELKAAQSSAALEVTKYTCLVGWRYSSGSQHDRHGT